VPPGPSAEAEANHPLLHTGGYNSQALAALIRLRSARLPSRRPARNAPLHDERASRTTFGRGPLGTNTRRLPAHDRAPLLQSVAEQHRCGHCSYPCEEQLDSRSRTPIRLRGEHRHAHFPAKHQIGAVSSRRPDSSVGATHGSLRSTAWWRRGNLLRPERGTASPRSRGGYAGTPARWTRRRMRPAVAALPARARTARR
jgi:hypothetical protein